MNMRFALPAVLAVLGAGAQAAVPADVSTAITAAGTDGATVAGLVIAAVVLLFGFKLMKRAIGG